MNVFKADAADVVSACGSACGRGQHDHKEKGFDLKRFSGQDVQTLSTVTDVAETVHRVAGSVRISRCECVYDCCALSVRTALLTIAARRLLVFFQLKDFAPLPLDRDTWGHSPIKSQSVLEIRNKHFPRSC